MNLGREPAIPPATPARTLPRCHIIFRHPFYDDSHNILLRLFASDSTTDAAGRGLYAQFALDACGVITGNRWDGWLSESKDPAITATATATTAIEPTSILQRSSYYFHLPPLQTDIDIGRPNAPYPIVPTFREWRFPHDELPDSWKRITSVDPDPVDFDRVYVKSNLTLALQTRDISCRITGCIEGTQVAHLCPQKENDWWYKNFMSRYNMDQENTPEDTSNALLLRADLHIAFDLPKFVFVPKPFSDPEHPQLVTHLLEASTELENLYHNRRLQSMRWSIETLFTRFAWTIFPLLDSFLTCQQRRRLLLVNEIVEDSADNDGFVSWEKCAQFSKTRSQSPKKRKLDTETANDCEADYAVDEEERSRSRGRTRYRCHYLATQSLDSSNSLSHTHIVRTAALPSHISSTPDPSETSPENDVPATLVNSDATFADARSNLKQTWLAHERLRSDPDQEWKNEQVWAKKVWKGDVTLDAKAARRWFEICGAEFQEEEQE
jgi:HNH endonuclease